MKLSLKNDRGVNRRVVLLIVLVAIVVAGLCLFGFLLTQIAPLQNLAESVPGPSTPAQVAGNVVAESPTSTPAAPADTSTPSPTESIPSPTLTPIPSPTLTPTLTPTPTRTPTLTRTPTDTPTPDPWVSLGQWHVACSTELTFDPVSASQFKFQMVAGGGDDKQISFYCCGSGGAEFFVNDAWLPVANPSLTLRVGETRETTDFGSAVVSRARFNIGCNDGEPMDVDAYYLPAPTPTITATATLTSTLALTTTATLTATIPVSATATPTSTIAPTGTLTVTSAVTATATLTATIPVSATATPTSTIAPTGTLTVTSAVTATATVTATRPPAPSGSIAFHKNDNGIDRAFVFNLDNNTVTPLVDIGPVMDLALSTNAPVGAWSPDNSKFAYISTVSPGGSNILRVVDFKANTTRALFSSDTGGGLSAPTWSPDGTKIAFVRLAANQRLWAIDVVNADATRCSTQYICEVTTNPRGEQFRGGLSWSKQGLYALASNTTGANDVYAMFADGSVRVNLTNNPTDNSTPIWSPDGKLIAFTSTRDGLPQIYLMNVDGSGLRRVSQGNAGDVSPTWSPDGNWIAFASTRDGSTDIYMMDLNGGNVTRLTKTGGDHPIWSH